MNDFSRDETEFGAFEDPSAPILVSVVGNDAAFGLKLPGFMRKTLQKVSGNKIHIPKNAQIDVKGSLKGLAKGVSIGVGIASFAIPGVGAITGSAALGGLVAADKLVAAGQKGVKEAHTVIDNTKKLAAAGNLDAQRGLQTLGIASQLRAASKIPHGVPSPVNAVGAAAHAQFLASRRPVVVSHPAARPVARPPAPAPHPVVRMPPQRVSFGPPQLAVPHPALMARPVAPLPYPMATPHPAAAPVVARPPVVMPHPAAVAARPAAPKPAAPEQHDWVVHDSGQVVRVVRGHAVTSAGGYYVGPAGVQRLGVHA
jgi:hypothetical protein